MRNIRKKCLIGVLLLPILAGAPSVLLGDEGQRVSAPMAPKTEDQLIQSLESKSANTVVSALSKLEDRFPSSTNAFAAMKKLLIDPRKEVRRKAARVLGVLHADVDQSDIRSICAFLKSSDENEVIDGLKALRGLKATEAVTEILPLLKHSNTHVVRDSCRTLAVLGNKETIPFIEPLLNRKEADVKKDAQVAIQALKAKS